MNKNREAEVLEEVHTFLRDLRMKEDARNRETIQNTVTNRHVLSAVQALGEKVDARVGALEHRMTGVESRVTLVEMGKRAVSNRPPPRRPVPSILGAQLTETGHHYMEPPSEEHPEGRVLTIEEYQKEAIAQARIAIAEDHRNEKAKLWDGLTDNARNVIVGVVIILIASAISLAVGMNLAAHHAPETHEGK